jgi:hypothetical protein
LNTIEDLLNSLRPRTPSARLKRRLFGRPGTEPAGIAAGAVLASGLKWLFEARHTVWTTASAMLLAAALLDGNAWVRGPATEKGFPVLAALSNQSWTACLSLAEVRHNSAPILDWTNDDYIPSTIRSLDNLNTNYLMPRL